MGLALDKGFNVVVNVGNSGPELAESLRKAFVEECRKRDIDPATVPFAAQTHGYLVENGSDRSLVERSTGHLHRIQARLRADVSYPVRGLNDVSGHEVGEPDYAGHSAASLIGSSDHMRRQAQRFADLGVSDLFVTYRFGEMQTPGIRTSMQAVAEAVAGIRVRERV